MADSTLPTALAHAATPRRITKRDQLIKVLRRKAGASITGLSETFGWQAHSTRATLTGLRKAGFVIERGVAKDSGLVTYRIVGRTEATANAASAPTSASTAAE